MSKFRHGVNTVRLPLCQNEELRQDRVGFSMIKERLIHKIRNKVVRGNNG